MLEQEKTELRAAAKRHRRNLILVVEVDKMAAEVEGVTLSHTHDQLRRQTVKHRMGKRDGLDRSEDVDMGSARDVAIDFMGGVVSGISGIIVGQVRLCAVYRRLRRSARLKRCAGNGLPLRRMKAADGFPAFSLWVCTCPSVFADELL